MTNSDESMVAWAESQNPHKAQSGCGIKGWETVFMRRLFGIKLKDEETWIRFCTRTARAGRSIRKKMKRPLLSLNFFLKIWREHWVGYVTDHQMQYCNAWAVSMREQSHELEPYMGVAKSMMSVGQDSLGMGRGGRQEKKRRPRCLNAVCKRDLVTFVLANMKHSFMHRHPNWRCRQTNKRK